MPLSKSFNLINEPLQKGHGIACHGAWLDLFDKRIDAHIITMPYVCVTRATTLAEKRERIDGRALQSTLAKSCVVTKRKEKKRSHIRNEQGFKLAYVVVAGCHFQMATSSTHQVS